MRSLEDIFKEALNDSYSAILDTPYVEARLVFGVKIVRDRESGLIEILNTTRGGDYYKEITQKEYQEFHVNGWRYGVYDVSLSNYRRKLDMIDYNVNEAILNLASKKEIEGYHIRRKNIMNRYAKISNKLNLLSNE
tara:strand:+ start:307 stop:714 length:408 start_codon:yes stop_codon:yes gene_type:complete